MKRQVLLASMALAMAGLLGCNESHPGGKTSDRTPSKETFSLKAPATSTTIKQGDKQTVKLTVDRGGEFKKDVTLKAESPAGISVDLEPRTVKASDNTAVNATVSVGKDAAIGDHTISVTGTPESGNATSIDIKIKVEKNSP